jgi:preprotein translocase subunit SecG
MYYLVLFVHIIVCLFLIVVVLLQSGKAADLAGAFGGMGSQTAFGPRGSATLLSKATTISAALFMLTSLSLSILATRSAGISTTVLEGAPAKTSPVHTAPPPQPAPQQQPGSQTIQVPLPKPDAKNPGKFQQVQIPVPQQQAPAQPAPAKKK